MAYRSAADQDTATASSIAAALLSYYTIAQVDGLLAGKLGVTEAASALQIAVRFPDNGGADEVVAAIGEQILGPTDVSLSNWTVRPSSGCSVVLATHTAGVSVDGYTLTLAANPWNIQLDPGPRGAGAPAARAGQVGRRGAERPAAGRPHRLQPEHAGEDEVRPGGDGRLHPVGRATKRAARELTGDDGNFVVTTDLGNEFATLGRAACGSRAPHEAARGPQRHCRGGPGHPDAEEGPGHEGGVQGRAVERPLRAGGRGLQRAAPTVHGAPENVEKQPATEFRVLQDNADKFQHNKDLTDRRVKAVQDAGSERRRTRRGASTLSTATCSSWPWTP